MGEDARVRVASGATRLEPEQPPRSVALREWMSAGRTGNMEDAAKPRPICSQDGRPAILVVEGLPLCVACYYQLQVAQTLGFRIAAIGMNHAAAEMDYMTGLGQSPRMQVPDIPRGPFILNNIKVDNSVVGSINTGNVQSIDVSITYLKESGNEQISAALKSLAEVIANATAIPAPEKNQLLDQVAYLSEQAVAAAKDRRPGMIQAAFAAITQGSGAIAAVATAWQAAAPLLKSYFGF